MRITLDLDEDVLLAAKERAARERKPLGAVISALARATLRGAPRRGTERTKGRFAVLPARDEVVMLEHVRSLQDREGV
jgi:hypothetical protein